MKRELIVTGIRWRHYNDGHYWGWYEGKRMFSIDRTGFSKYTLLVEKKIGKWPKWVIIMNGNVPSTLMGVAEIHAARCYE